MVLGRCGIDIRGRSRKLRLNYRTTEETRSWASRLLSGRDIDDLDGGADDNRGIRSLTRGPEPVLRHFGSQEEQNDYLIHYLRELESQGQSLRAVCVVARTNEERRAVEEALRAEGIESTVIERNTIDDDARGGVRVATMHRVKGLEFERVVMAGINRGLVPLSAAIDGKSDAAAPPIGGDGGAGAAVRGRNARQEGAARAELRGAEPAAAPGLIRRTGRGAGPHSSSARIGTVISSFSCSQRLLVG